MASTSVFGAGKSQAPDRQNVRVLSFDPSRTLHCPPSTNHPHSR